MNHQGAVGLWIFQNAVCNHVLGTFKNLLCRLEHQLYGSGKLLFMGFQKLRGAKKHGGVHIMAAGVHEAVPAGKFLTAFLRDGQGIHIRPEKECFSGFPHGGSQPRLTAFFRMIPHPFQLLPDILLCPAQFKPDFRMTVEPSPVDDHFFLQKL